MTKKKINEEEKLSGPQYVYRNMVNAMFEEDPDITVSEVFQDNNEDPEDNPVFQFTITTENITKCGALLRLIKRNIDFGNLSLKINICYNKNDDFDIGTYKDLFNGNEIFDRIDTKINPITKEEYDYVVFKKKVLQYYTDNLSDINANTSSLAEDISRKIFNESPIMFCTDNKE